MRCLFLAMLTLYTCLLPLNAALQPEAIQQLLANPPEIGSPKGKLKSFCNISYETMQNNTHLQFLERPDPDLQLVVLTFEGGEKEETVANYGINQAAFETWIINAFSEETMRQSLWDRKIFFQLLFEWDFTSLCFVAPADQLDYVLAVIHLLVKNPDIELNTLRTWKAHPLLEHTRHTWEAYKPSDCRVIDNLTDCAVKEKLDESSLRFQQQKILCSAVDSAVDSAVEQILVLEHQYVTNWIAQHVKTGPLNVTWVTSVEGDKEAYALKFMRYLESLPNRKNAGIISSWFLGTLDNRKGPFECSVNCAGPLASVTYGYMCEMPKSAERNLAAAALEYYFGYSSMDHLPQYGSVLVRVEVEPAQLEETLTRLDQEFAKLINQDISESDWKAIQNLAKRKVNTIKKSVVFFHEGPCIWYEKGWMHFLSNLIDESSPAKVKEWLQTVAKKQNHVRLIAKPELSLQSQP